MLVASSRMILDISLVSANEKHPSAPINSRLNVVVRTPTPFGLGRNGCWPFRGSQLPRELLFIRLERWSEYWCLSLNPGVGGFFSNFLIWHILHPGCPQYCGVHVPTCMLQSALQMQIDLICHITYVIKLSQIIHCLYKHEIFLKYMHNKLQHNNM